MRLSILIALLPVVLGAPLLSPRAGTVIKGKYIVKFKDSEVSTNALEDAIAMLEKPAAHVYKAGKFKGFAAEISDSLVKKIQALPNVRTGLLKSRVLR